jgi:hypothetical protein
VAYFLKNYQEQAGARLTQTSLTLLDQCNQKITAAQEKIKERTKGTIRCIPFDQTPEPGVCMVTGKPSAGRVVFAKAY